MNLLQLTCRLLGFLLLDDRIRVWINSVLDVFNAMPHVDQNESKFDHLSDFGKVFAALA